MGWFTLERFTLHSIKTIAMLKIHSIYGCSQQTLYTIAALVWTNYAANLTSFSDLKGKYTKDYATNALLAVAAAKALPTKHARNSIPEAIRVQLVPLGLTCLGNQRKLKSYIHEVFTDEEAIPMLAAAGFNSYHPAYNGNWAEMNAMINSGDLFIAKNSTVLQAGTTNMPLPFVATYTSDKTAFETIYNNYIASVQSISGATIDKITANNAVYSTLIAMMEDGRLIFENDVARKALFTFSTVLNTVTGNGTTGMRITVIDNITKLNIPGFTATVQPGDESAEATSDVMELKMPADIYTLVIMAPDYPDYIVENIQLTTGVMHRIDIVLTKNKKS